MKPAKVKMGEIRTGDTSRGTFGKQLSTLKENGVHRNMKEGEEGYHEQAAGPMLRDAKLAWVKGTANSHIK